MFIYMLKGESIMKIKDEKNSLESMLVGSPEKLSGGNTPQTDDLVQEPLITTNFETLSDECDKEARKMLVKAIGHIFSNSEIRYNPYLRNKIKVDVMSLSGMIYQLKVNTLMQKTLMDQVSMGAATPKNFEVFSMLSKTIGDINKQLLATVEAIKITYKDIKLDIRERTIEDSQSAIASPKGNIAIQQQNDGSMISRGSKDLISELRKRKISNSDENKNEFD